MHDVCDHSACPAWAVTRWRRPGTDGALVFCQHHSNEQAATLHDAGWRLVLGGPALVPGVR